MNSFRGFLVSKKSAVIHNKEVYVTEGDVVDEVLEEKNAEGGTLRETVANRGEWT